MQLRTWRTVVFVYTLAPLSVLQGQKAVDLLSAIPNPPDDPEVAYTVCGQPDSPAIDPAFEGAYQSAKDANDKAQRSLMEEMQKNPSASMKGLAQVMGKWQQFAMAPGAPAEVHTRADMFKPLIEKANSDKEPFEAQQQRCDPSDGKAGAACYEAAIRAQRNVDRKLAADVVAMWPEYITAVKKNVLWDSRQPPKEIDLKLPFIRQQLLAMEANAIRDARIAAEEQRAVCGIVAGASGQVPP